MKITYDIEARVVYVYVSDNKIEKTVREGENIIVDLDSRNKIVGMEILGWKDIEDGTIRRVAKKYNNNKLVHYLTNDNVCAILSMLK